MTLSKTLIGFALLCLMAMVIDARPDEFGRQLLSAPTCHADYKYDYFGGDIKRIDHVHSWQECCGICKDYKGCKGYTYRKDFKHCWLKHTLSNYQYCEHCYTQKFPVVPAPKCSAIYQYDYFGGDIKRIDHVHSWQHCCTLCKEHHGCKGYTWRKDFKHCWLKHTLANYQYCKHCYTQAFHH